MASSCLYPQIIDCPPWALAIHWLPRLIAQFHLKKPEKPHQLGWGFNNKKNKTVALCCATLPFEYDWDLKWKLPWRKRPDFLREGEISKPGDAIHQGEWPAHWALQCKKTIIQQKHTDLDAMITQQSDQQSGTHFLVWIYKLTQIVYIKIHNNEGE